MPDFAVNKHPQKQRVIDGILAGESLRSIAKSLTPPLSDVAIWRFRKHILVPGIQRGIAKVNELKRMRDDCLPSADSVPHRTASEQTAIFNEARKEANRDAIVSPFISRINAKYERYDRLLKTAEKGQVVVDKEGKPVTLSPDLKAIAALDACETRSMDLHAKLVGAIAPESSGVVTNNIVLMLPRPVDDAPARPMLDDGNCIDIEPVE